MNKISSPSGVCACSVKVILPPKEMRRDSSEKQTAATTIKLVGHKGKNKDTHKREGGATLMVSE